MIRERELIERRAGLRGGVGSLDDRVAWLLTAEGRRLVEGEGPLLPRGRSLPAGVGPMELEFEWQDAVSNVLYSELPRYLSRHPQRFVLPDGRPDRAHLANNARLRAGQRMLDVIIARRRERSLDAPLDADGSMTLLDITPDPTGGADRARDQAAAVEAGLEILDREALARFLARCSEPERKSYRLRSCAGTSWGDLARRLAHVGEDPTRVSRRLRKRYSRLTARAPKGLARFFEAGGCTCNLGDRCALEPIRG